MSQSPLVGWNVSSPIGKQNKARSRIPEAPPQTGKKVAVVGSGPAGLTAAADLARMGHQVDVFEALHEPGGVLVYGIPEFRLPKAIVKREVDYVNSLGVRGSSWISSSALLPRWMNCSKNTTPFYWEQAQACPGSWDLPGENLGGVYSSNEYLTRVNLMKAYRPEYDTPVSRGNRVLTIGGGNTAMDAARTALRLGSKESIIVYRRSRAEMPARAEEIHHAEEEGVQFNLLTTPIAFHGKDGRVTALECIKNELGEPDASGRRKPVPIEGSNFMIEADVMVIAIGQSPSPLIANTTPELETRKNGTVTADSWHDENIQERRVCGWRYHHRRRNGHPRHGTSQACRQSH